MSIAPVIAWSAPRASCQVFRPHVDRAEPDQGFWHVRATDGREADIYATVAPETFDSLMITHFSAGAVLHLLAEFVHQADAVVLPPGGPAMPAADTQRRHLPDEFQGEAVVELDGRHIGLAALLMSTASASPQWPESQLPVFPLQGADDGPVV